MALNEIPEGPSEHVVGAFFTPDPPMKGLRAQATGQSGAERAATTVIEMMKRRLEYFFALLQW
jgi:hypothetical protein